jgi:hypothetical protein
MSIRRKTSKEATRIVLLAMLLPLIATGCLKTARKTIPIRPSSVVMNADAVQLIANVNRDFEAIHSLILTVQIQASVSKADKGEANDYTPLPGHILFRKPGDLRVLGQVPVLHTTAFDMASDGTNFKLVIPSRNKAIVGTDTVTKKSANALENLRPFMFVDAMLVRPILPTEQVLLTTHSDTEPDPTRKFLVQKSEYDLTIVQPQAGSQVIPGARVIHFKRDNLLPYKQDFYNKESTLEEQVIYGDYQQFGNTRFPGTITIRRPLDEYQIVLTIQNVKLNQELQDNQFKVDIPDGTVIQKLE